MLCIKNEFEVNWVIRNLEVAASIPPAAVVIFLLKLLKMEMWLEDQRIFSEGLQHVCCPPLRLHWWFASHRVLRLTSCIGWALVRLLRRNLHFLYFLQECYFKVAKTSRNISKSFWIEYLAFNLHFLYLVSYL